MFSKTFRVKANTQLKGSERKKFRGEVLKNFIHLQEDDLVELLPNKEVIVLMKIHTHSGESVLVYCVEKLPLVFVIEGVMYPTVYMLWKFPNLVYSFTTWPQVFPKITGGADLMLPGVVLKDGFNIKAFGKLDKGDRVYVNLTNNKAAIAVGRAALSSMDMYMSAKRGKAVNILHFIGDELWGYGTKLPTPNLGPPEGFNSSGSDDETEDPNPKDKVTSSNLDCADNSTISCLAERIGEVNCFTDNINVSFESSSVEPSDEPLSVEPLCFEPSDYESSTETDTLDHANQVSVDTSQIIALPENSEKCLDDKDAMDELVDYCFLKALNTTAKKVEYPLLSSKFFKLHMLAACPSGKSIDLKKSSYKKLSVFLNKMNSLGVVCVRELTKGVESIMSVNMGHELLRKFVDVYADESTASTSQVTALDSSCRPEITEMYVITAAALPVFSRFGMKKGASLSVSLARTYITDYIKMEGLQSAENKRLVQVNETLSKLLGTELNSRVTWDELFTKILGRMTRSYQMSFSGQQSIFNKGKLEPIDIQVGKRTGNKKVTLINNLELYGINLNEFARECQHGVAASTSISTVPGRKTPQLMVQGNQVLFVGSLLTGKYSIPKRYLRGLENAPKTNSSKGHPSKAGGPKSGAPKAGAPKSKK